MDRFTVAVDVGVGKAEEEHELEEAKTSEHPIEIVEVSTVDVVREPAAASVMASETYGGYVDIFLKLSSLDLSN